MSNNFIQSVDERTQLAGANRLEILLFSLGIDKKTGREEVFGLNVFKIREVIQVPEITHAPDMPPGVMGMVSLRGTMLPVIDLASFCGMEAEEPADKLIITEFNKTTQGMLVKSVEQIIRMEWNDILVPPAMMAHQMGGLVTAVTELEDGRIAMIVDVEKVLSETAGTDDDESAFETIEKTDFESFMLFADDSLVARKQIEKTIQKMGINYVSAKNGEDAWEKLQELATRAEAMGIETKDYLKLILTDVEMPGMDGYVLTKKIKSDERFKGIPVLMHSSLSADTNMALGKQVGADHYLPKFDPLELSKAVLHYITPSTSHLDNNS
ncbi:MAG: chemotaxis protein [Gammaproteobacteria bacterium]|nr:chemotaxis protein [Gammaproteobacteria bacterium]